VKLKGCKVVDKSKADDVRIGEPYLVLELCHDRRELLGSITVVQSIPGREGTLTWRYKAPYGIIDAGQLRDLTSRVAKVVEDATVTWTGVQGVLGG